MNVEIDFIRKDNKRKERLNQTQYDTSAIVNSLNDDKILNNKSNIYTRCLMLMPKESFLANTTN